MGSVICTGVFNFVALCDISTNTKMIELNKPNHIHVHAKGPALSCVHSGMKLGVSSPCFVEGSHASVVLFTYCNHRVLYIFYKKRTSTYECNKLLHKEHITQRDKYIHKLIYSCFPTLHKKKEKKKSFFFLCVCVVYILLVRRETTTTKWICILLVMQLFQIPLNSGRRHITSDHKHICIWSLMLI